MPPIKSLRLTIKAAGEMTYFDGKISLAVYVSTSRREHVSRHAWITYEGCFLSNDER